MPGFTRRRNVLYRQGREVEMSSLDGQRIPMQIDGDPAGGLPATFRVQPRALRVIAPVEPKEKSPA
jgi:diacylglycerol kinase family enzyme